MNAETLEAIANVMAAIDNATSAHNLTLAGTVKLGDVNGEDALGYLKFNDGVETTFSDTYPFS